MPLRNLTYATSNTSMQQYTEVCTYGSYYQVEPNKVATSMHFLCDNSSAPGVFSVTASSYMYVNVIYPSGPYNDSLFHNYCLPPRKHEDFFHAISLLQHINDHFMPRSLPNVDTFDAENVELWKMQTMIIF